ncbi:DUF5689 domain-containing protein [uncultured Alistipes sp.]|uniref:DUF5689 domain-containing protein n=1 Tax=uncultured Alistipes sp. TaxID=538949 RepID=UPI00320AE8D0
MKKHLFGIWTAALLLAGAAVSCTSDPEVDSVGRVGITQESLTASGEGEELTLDVTSNSYWHIDFTDPATGEAVRWITPSETYGMGDAAVKLVVARNRSTSARQACIHVTTDSESSTVSILLSQGAGTVGGGDGYGFPIYQMFSIDANLMLSNAFIEGGTCYFDDGMILSRTGSPADMTFSTQTHTNPKSDWYFQRGVVIGSWETGDALQLQIPLKEALSGDLRYMYGSRRDGTQNANHAWRFEWSADGASWTPFDKASVGGASDAVWKIVDFTIPAEKQIPAGGTLWIRHYCTDGSSASTSDSKPTVAFQTGFCITKATAEASEVPAMDDETIVFSTGFDDVRDAVAAYIDLPLDFMSSFNAGAYSLPKEHSGIVAFDECYTRPGFLQVGRGDEAIVSRYTQGSYTIQLASRFEAMRILKSDLKLTFLATAMIDAYGNPTDPGVVVKVDGASGATVEGGELEGVANNEFKPFTVYVRGATPETEITITSAAMASSTDDVRFFVDDIVLAVEGEPQRPSADDPVKATIAELRGKAGASEVTVSDNLYIQGTVVSVDNVPQGCFAVQDDEAGIFVSAPNHGLTVGDQVEVVVKGAKLAKDADGLLVVTPTAATQVTRSGTATELPAERSISVGDLAAGTYEAMRVLLPESQVVDADLSKTLSGTVTLELEDRVTTYSMKTYAHATFASTTVPQKRGPVKGIAGAGYVLPASVSDLSAMNGTRFGEAVYAITPIDGMLKMLLGGTPSVYSATYDAASKTLNYTNGCSVYKVGNEDLTTCELTCKKTPYDGRFQTTGWGGDNWQDNGLVFKIKATSRIVGNLRFGFGMFSNKSIKGYVPAKYKIKWSNNNRDWYDGVRVLVGPYTGEGTEEFTIPTQANSGGYKMAYFNVPESKAVAEGDYIYIKIVQADNTTALYPETGIKTDAPLLLQHAFYLATHEKRAYHTSVLPSGENVLLTEGFDDAFLGHDYFIPTWQMGVAQNIPNKYAVPEGWSVDANNYVYELPGYIRLGLDDSASGAGSITTPALAALGDASADVTLTFKIAVHMGGSSSYKPDPITLTVTAEGAGTAAAPVHDLASLPEECKPATEAEAKVMEDAYYKWYPVTVKISGATKDTRITIGGTGRHYIDDIVITKD